MAVTMKKMHHPLTAPVPGSSVTQPVKHRSNDSNSTHRDLFTDVYVRNLSCSTEVGLRNLFDPFGAIHSLSLMVNPSDPRRRSGVVTFEKHTSAFNAVASLHESDPESSGRLLFVARARSKGERESLRRKQAELPTYIWFDVDVKLNQQVSTILFSFNVIST